jgi:streptogramin lyase
MDQGQRPFLITAAVAAALIALPACGGGGGQSLPTVHTTATPGATPTPALTPTPAPTAAPQRLYVSALDTAGPISYFTSPFTNASLPTASFAIQPTGETSGLAIGPTGNILASDAGLDTITSYARPAPTTTTQFSFSTGFTPSGLAFGEMGNLYVADYAGGVDIVTNPISASSTLTPVVTTGLTHPYGICFDAAENMYIADQGAADVAVYAPPYTGAPIILNTGTLPDFGVAYDAASNELAVAVANGSGGNVLFYSLPVTAGSSPNANFVYTASAPFAVAFDQSGKLYVSVLAATTHTINVYTAPFLSNTDPVPTISFASPIVATTPEPVFSMTFGT